MSERSFTVKISACVDCSYFNRYDEACDYYGDTAPVKHYTTSIPEDCPMLLLKKGIKNYPVSSEDSIEVVADRPKYSKLEVPKSNDTPFRWKKINNA
jgi:hypothetical protein